jgi:hypothetical protein
VGNSRRNLLRIFLLFCVLALAGLVWQWSDAKNGDARYFHETGHWVTGEFLAAYESVEDPLMLYGYPITDAFEDKKDHRIVQYFERARFELHPEEETDQLVQRTRLGELLNQAGPSLPATSNHPDCQTFPETPFQVCHAFLDFFNANGNLAQFGYPISNFEIHDDRIVQYFELARLEWHPELPVDQRVKISDLGVKYFEVMKENPRLRDPSSRYNPIQIIEEIQSRAFPRKAIVGPEDEQEIYVIVQDQNLKPVVGASVEIEVDLPSGDILQSGEPVKTDQDGIAVFKIRLPDEPAGETITKVKTRYQNFEAVTSTSFRVWR